MQDHIIPANARLSRPKGIPKAPDCVRTYRSDPEGITLQIRLENGTIATAWLPFVAARTLAQAIIDSCNAN